MDNLLSLTLQITYSYLTDPKRSIFFYRAVLSLRFPKERLSYIMMDMRRYCFLQEA